MEVPLTKDAWLKEIQVHWNLNRGNMALFLKKEWNKKKISHLFYAMASMPGQLYYGSYALAAMTGYQHILTKEVTLLKIDKTKPWS